jgi:hypothetical protein
MEMAMRICTFERHDEEMAVLEKLLARGQYGEARERAASRLAELRRDWGYQGRSEGHRFYLQGFLRLQARASRGLLGLSPV